MAAAWDPRGPDHVAGGVGAPEEGVSSLTGGFGSSWLLLLALVVGGKRDDLNSQSNLLGSQRYVKCFRKAGFSVVKKMNESRGRILLLVMLK